MTGTSGGKKRRIGGRREVGGMGSQGVCKG